MSHSFNQKVFKAKPPDKGSFPLDHEGDCKRGALLYLYCLKENNNDSSYCRHLAQDYLRCRMENDLMAKEEWSRLGFKDETEKPTNEPKVSVAAGEDAQPPQPQQ